MKASSEVLFGDALQIALERTQEVLPALREDVTLVRDLRGRIRILLSGAEDDYKGERRESVDGLAKTLSDSLGAYGYPPEQGVLYLKELFQDLTKELESDRRDVGENGQFKVYLLDRQVTGQDWMRNPFEEEFAKPRFTFYGIKGGVGRSTALIVWAWRLAKKGRKVLIFDLDLESPGVSGTLLPEDNLPDYGIVDWLVEDAVGQADAISGKLTALSPLATPLLGEIRVVPSYGSKTADYMSKLSRCYLQSNGGGAELWADRLRRMIEQLEASETPDLTILDSRAGLHDIAAVVATRMNAETLLFAVDSPQTWKAYSILFDHWKHHPKVRDFRERLKIVAGLVPETERPRYLEGFRARSWDVFRDSLYDEAAPDNTDVFSFDIGDEDAPHFPLPVFWHRALQEFNPTASQDGIEERTVAESLGLFMDGADKIFEAAREAKS